MPAQRVVFGAGRLDAVPAELEDLGLRRILLIATRSAKAAADHLGDRLGPRVAARIHDVVQHVPVEDAEAAVADARRHDADGVLTIGGGSATGLGKAVAVETGLPLVAVPTTYSGSEATPVYGITAEHKVTARDRRALPRVVVYDPMLTLTMPARLTVTSGLNAIAHGVEALYARDANPVASAMSRDAIRRLARALPTLAEAPEDVAARTDALLAAYLAGWSMASAGTALHHRLCHLIGGTFRVDHGEVHGVLLPYVVAYNAGAAPEAVNAVAESLHTTTASAGLRRLAEHLGAPTDLAGIGVPEDALDDLATRAVTAVGDSNPRVPDAPSLRRLLGDAHRGEPPGAY